MTRRCEGSTLPIHFLNRVAVRKTHHDGVCACPFFFEEVTRTEHCRAPLELPQASPPQKFSEVVGQLSRNLSFVMF